VIFDSQLKINRKLKKKSFSQTNIKNWIQNQQKCTFSEIYVLKLQSSGRLGHQYTWPLTLSVSKIFGVSTTKPFFT